jgi:carbonic anhydrase
MKYQRAKEAVRYLLSANAHFMENHGPEDFEPFLTAQEPRVTVVCCSDSRVHMRALHDNPVNDLFVIRNIGNQLSTSMGSVEYAVCHLRTPVLLILGHVRCGAIHAALGDYAEESPAIRSELETLQIPKGGDWLDGVRANVNRQVAQAIGRFSPEVESGALAVLGAIYDFANDLGEGHGKLVITNIQGESERHAVKAAIAMHLKP